MKQNNIGETENIYPICRRIMGDDLWGAFIADRFGNMDIKEIPDRISLFAEDNSVPDFLPDLALLEKARYIVSEKEITFPDITSGYEINPSLELVQLSWAVTGLYSKKRIYSGISPEHKAETALVWKDLLTGDTNIKSSTNEDLLVLKILSEELSSDDVAKDQEISVSRIEELFRNAVKRGIIFEPLSKLRRDTSVYADTTRIPGKYLFTSTFTVQWHLTHVCDLNCKHCYDRSNRTSLSLSQAEAVIDDMVSFCAERNVKGHVCLTGGNPLLYPYFFEIYKKASKAGFSASILGNPASEDKIVALAGIEKPRYFQVSLEGLEEHNDNIRGKGNYRSVLDFLALLEKMGISSAVMLTLTRDNIDQVIPLARQLEGKTDHFTFNRLSQTGRGADLLLPDKSRYERFLIEYIKASKKNPIMGFKDNLINIFFEREGRGLFPGCTGYGCGAAFNFITILPDGEAHACRKFPSPIGNVLNERISDIYDSEKAEKYRKGSASCTGCRIRHVCGGCMAITNGTGHDPFADRDPYCCIDDNK